MPQKRYRLAAAILLLLMACTLPGNPDLPVSLPIFDLGSTDEPNSVVIPADPNATPTPFLPLGPTTQALTPTPLPAPPWGSFPGPTVPSSYPIPSPAEPLELPAGQINVLLLGSDQRPASGGFRTDTIVVLSLNPELGTASMTSFPRDLYVYIPGWTMQRINTAFPHDGFSQIQSTFEYNFGFTPDFYALINFWSFVQLIDSLGGINVSVAVPLTDHRDGQGEYTVPSGLVAMDGETALWYVRSRGTTNDFDRTRRQQEVLIAIFFRMVSLNGLQRAPELYNLYQNNVETNASFSDIAPLLGLAADLAGDTSNLATYTIGSGLVTSYRTEEGAAVLLPDGEAIRSLLREALNVP